MGNRFSHWSPQPSPAPAPAPDPAPVLRTYECGTSNWQCDTYNYQLPGSSFQNYTNNDKQNWARSCRADWPQATGSYTTPAYYTCNLRQSMENTTRRIGTIPLSENPIMFALTYIFENNFLPNQDAYFAHYSDGKNYNIFL